MVLILPWAPVLPCVVNAESSCADNEDCHGICYPPEGAPDHDA